MTLLANIALLPIHPLEFLISPLLEQLTLFFEFFSSSLSLLFTASNSLTSSSNALASHLPLELHLAVVSLVYNGQCDCCHCQKRSFLLYRALEVVVLSRLLLSSSSLLYIELIVSPLFVNNAIMIIVFNLWTKRSIWYLFELSNCQFILIFFSFLCILTNLFPFLNKILVPTYDESLYYLFYSHCKKAESIQIFIQHFFHYTTKFFLQ